MGESHRMIVTGTEAEILDLANRIQRDCGIDTEVSSVPDIHDGWTEEPRLGQADITTLAIDFVIAIGAHATYDSVLATIRSFTSMRPHVKVSEMERDLPRQSETDR